MKTLKSLGLAGMVAGSMLFTGCQAVEDRVGDVLHGRAFPFNQPAQQNNSSNNGQQNNVNYGGRTGNSFNSGEVKEIGAFGETYAITAVNYLGKPGTAHIIPNNFINIRNEFGPGQKIFIGFRIPNSSIKDVVFRLYNDRGNIEIESAPAMGIADASLININTPSTPGNYTYLFTGKSYKEGLFGKSIGEETPIVRGQITIR